MKNPLSLLREFWLSGLCLFGSTTVLCLGLSSIQDEHTPTFDQPLPLPELGRHFSALDGLETLQAQRGFSLIGRFDPPFPARVMSVRTTRDRADVVDAAGERHEFRGYTGYVLKIVTLVDPNGRAGVLVWKSGYRLPQQVSAL